MEEKMKNELKVRAEILREIGLEPMLSLLVERHSAFITVSDELKEEYEGDLVFGFMQENLKKVIEKFENEFETQVLFGMLDQCFDDTMLSLVFVSKYEDEWEMERNDLKNKCPIAMCFNLEDGCREGGYIEFEIEDGKPFRTV